MIVLLLLLVFVICILELHYAATTQYLIYHSTCNSRFLSQEYRKSIFKFSTEMVMSLQIACNSLHAPLDKWLKLHIQNALSFYIEAE